MTVPAPQTKQDMIKDDGDPTINRLLTKFKDMAKDKDLAKESYFGGGNDPTIAAKYQLSNSDQKDDSSTYRPTALF